MTNLNRIEKINEFLKKELSKIILKEIGFPRDILVTITSVKTFKDLSECKVFVSVFPEKETKKVLEILNRSWYGLHQLLNKVLKIRRVPKLSFLKRKN